MTHNTETLIRGVRYRSLVQPARLTVVASAICLLMAATSSSAGFAGTNTAQRTTEMDCVVTDGRGVVDVASGAQPEYSQSALARDGLALGDKARLFWDYSPETPSALRVALDSPVTKGARLVSITDDTVSAVLMTSDSLTTRAWLITVNFRLERVMVSGMSSNSNAMNAQIMTLSCTFTDRPATTATDSQ